MFEKIYIYHLIASKWKKRVFKFFRWTPYCCVGEMSALGIKPILSEAKLQKKKY